MKLYAVALVLHTAPTTAQLIASWQFAMTDEDAISNAVKMAAKRLDLIWTKVDAQVIQIPVKVST